MLLQFQYDRGNSTYMAVMLGRVGDILADRSATNQEKNGDKVEALLGLLYLKDKYPKALPMVPMDMVDPVLNYLEEQIKKVQVAGEESLLTGAPYWTALYYPLAVNREELVPWASLTEANKEVEVLKEEA